MSTIYQLRGEGDSVNGWLFKVWSRQLWTDKTKAEAGIPEFTRNCTDKQRFFEAATPESLNVTIIERELVE